MLKRAITGPAWTDLSFIKRWNGTAWVDVSFVRRWDGTAWVQVWPALSTLAATVTSPTALGGASCTYAGVGDNVCPFLQTVVSESVTVSSSGGTGVGPTYLWSYLSGDTGIAVSNPTATTVSFSGAVGRRQSKTAIWRCTVTRGLDTAFVDVSITLTYNYVFEGEVLP